METAADQISQDLGINELKEVLTGSTDGVFVCVGKRIISQEEAEQIRQDNNRLESVIAEDREEFREISGLSCEQYVPVFIEIEEGVGLVIFGKIGASSGFEDKTRFEQGYYENLGGGGFRLADSLEFWNDPALVETLRAKKNIRCLVLGTGVEENLGALHKYFQANQVDAKIVCVDYNHDTLLRSDRSPYKCGNDNFIQADIAELPFNEGQFDLIIGDFILYCLSPDRIPGFFQEVSKHLKNDGQLLISVRCASEEDVFPNTFNINLSDFGAGRKVFLRTSLSSYLYYANKAGLRHRINGVAPEEDDSMEVYYLTFEKN